MTSRLRLPPHLILFFLLHYSHPSEAVCNTKIVVVWAEPEKEGLGTAEEVSNWDQCRAKCWQEEDCLLISQTMPDKDEENAPCQLYRFGNITAIKKLDEGSRKRVGFKRKLEQPEDMCPFSDDPPMFGDASFSLGYISDKTYYGVNISMYKDEWIFHYFTSKCVLTSSTLFVRCQVAVCLELRWFTKPPYMNNQANASMLCKEKNGLGLTGNYNADEYSWMASEATPKKAQAAGIPDYEVGKGIWFWVDGKSEKRLKQFVMEDDTHGGTSAYPWWTNQPDGTDVLFCLYMLYRQNYIDDIWCTSNDRYRGGVCRTQIITTDS